MKYTLTVLLVEDEEYKVTKIISYLARYPYLRLELAVDQLGALSKLEDEKFDLLILDMQLPIRRGEQPNPNGGERILMDLDSDDGYMQPHSIVVLTQYDELQSQLRIKFEDIAAVKFRGDSDSWQLALDRTISRCLRSKKEQKKIIYCEGHNASYYNLIGFKNVEFRGLADCRAIYLAAKNEKDKFSLRDRDFLTKKEISKLKAKHKNYYILDYYCFENYLYHPDNISEIDPAFDKVNYIGEITRQKNNKLMTVIQDYKLARNAYTELNDDNKHFLDTNPEDDIVKCLQSNDFESFYQYFDMAGKKDKKNQKSFDKEMLMAYNFKAEQLVQTVWFRDTIGKLLF